MNRSLLSALVPLALLVGSPALAQKLELPPASPGGKLVQTVGLTDITVEFSSPSAHGRKIWGELVPYDQVWRTGANAATKVTFSRDVVIGGTLTPKGSYALFAIPAKLGNWTVILNKDANQWGSQEYKQAADLVRVSVKPTPIAARERLAYSIEFGFDQNAATLHLDWEKVRLSLPITLKTDEQAAAQIKGVSDDPSGLLVGAARYLLESKKSPDQALDLITRAIAIKETWYSDWLYAQLLWNKGKKADAIAAAQKAKTLGDQNPAGFFYKEPVDKALKEWPAKK